MRINPLYLRVYDNICLLGQHGSLSHRFVRLPFPLCPAADAINNAAGFGFRGYDKNGAAHWDLISNLRIKQIEVSASSSSQSP